MSLYRVRIDVWVKNDADLPFIKNKLSDLVSKFTNIKNKNGTIERAHISYHECNHDIGLPCPEDTVLWEKKTLNIQKK